MVWRGRVLLHCHCKEFILIEKYMFVLISMSGKGMDSNSMKTFILCFNQKLQLNDILKIGFPFVLVYCDSLLFAQFELLRMLPPLEVFFRHGCCSIHFSLLIYCCSVCLSLSISGQKKHACIYVPGKRKKKKNHV